MAYIVTTLLLTSNFHLFSTCISIQQLFSTPIICVLLYSLSHWNNVIEIQAVGRHSTETTVSENGRGVYMSSYLQNELYRPNFSIFKMLHFSSAITF